MPSFAAARSISNPDQIALRDHLQEFSWSDIDRILNRIANGMLALDPTPVRRVAIFAQNSAETLLAHLGGLIGGASTVPVSFHLTAPELAYILEDSGSTVLFVGPETARTGLEAARLARIPLVIGWRCQPAEGIVHWNEWLDRASPHPPPLDHAPRANLMYTSGTTGRPKGTELPPTMFAGGATVEEHLERLARAPFALFGMHLVAGPLYHTGPLTGVRVLGGGKPVVVLPKFDAEAVLAAIDDYKVESSVLVPTHFIRLLALPEDIRKKYSTRSLKFVFHTGSACPVDVKRGMLDWWGPVLYEAYGATEVGTTCAISPHDWLKHPGSVGKPVPPFSVLVTDDQGRELPAGTEGRLYFRDSTGRGIVYHNDPAKSAAAHLAPGIFTLGEIGYVDAGGFVYITDRFSDMVVSGGVNIYPAESESVILRHPQVDDVACIGVPHPVMGEELKALVVAADPGKPPPAQEIINFCKANLAHYKCPKSVDFVGDLGRTAAGKVNKKKLKAPYWPESRSP